MEGAAFGGSDSGLEVGWGGESNQYLLLVGQGSHVVGDVGILLVFAMLYWFD